MAVVGCVAVVAALGAGCGGDGEEAAGAGATEYSWAKESPKTFAERLAKLLETTAKGDCEQLEAINARSTTQFPCPPERSLARSMAKFRVLGSEEHGTGAVVDYRSGAVADSAAIVLTVAPGREWAVSHFGLFTGESVGTGDERARDGYDKAVSDYLQAVRDRDCRALARLDFQPPGAGNTSCKDRRAATEELAKTLEANPGAKPVYRGGNATFGFHTLETRKPELRSVTIATMRQPPTAGDGRPSHLVLNVVASPTSADQRSAIEAFER